MGAVKVSKKEKGATGALLAIQRGSPGRIFGYLASSSNAEGLIALTCVLPSVSPQPEGLHANVTLCASQAHKVSFGKLLLE